MRLTRPILALFTCLALLISLAPAGAAPLAGGIKPLQTLIVAGTAKKPAGSDALVIEANEIYVVP